MNEIMSTEFAHLSSTCLAYVGPGSGVTMLWSLIAILGGILFMVFGLLFWPVRILLRSLKKKKANSKSKSPPESESQAFEVICDTEQIVPRSEHN